MVLPTCLSSNLPTYLGSVLVKIMLISGCCDFRFVIRLPPLHALHLPPRPSCILSKSVLNFLTTLRCAHCLHLARRVGFCHHPALSTSSSCCPLHQEPDQSRTGLSLSNLSTSCQSERCCQAWILLAFSVASCPPAHLSDRRIFFEWMTPVKLCSIVICMLIDSLLYQSLSSI